MPQIFATGKTYGSAHPLSGWEAINVHLVFLPYVKSPPISQHVQRDFVMLWLGVPEQVHLIFFHAHYVYAGEGINLFLLSLGSESCVCSREWMEG